MEGWAELQKDPRTGWAKTWVLGRTVTIHPTPHGWSKWIVMTPFTLPVVQERPVCGGEKALEEGVMLSQERHPVLWCPLLCGGGPGPFCPQEGPASRMAEGQDGRSQDSEDSVAWRLTCTSLPVSLPLSCSL